jgi:hypothetical protein
MSVTVPHFSIHHRSWQAGPLRAQMFLVLDCVSITRLLWKSGGFIYTYILTGKNKDWSPCDGAISTLVNFYQSTQRTNSEDSHLHSRLRENLKSQKYLQYSQKSKSAPFFRDGIPACKAAMKSELEVAD